MCGVSATPKAESELAGLLYTTQQNNNYLCRARVSPRPHLNLDMICYAKSPAKYHLFFVVVRAESPQLLLGDFLSQSIVEVQGGH